MSRVIDRDEESFFAFVLLLLRPLLLLLSLFSHFYDARNIFSIISTQGYFSEHRGVKLGSKKYDQYKETGILFAQRGQTWVKKI